MMFDSFTVERQPRTTRRQSRGETGVRGNSYNYPLHAKIPFPSHTDLNFRQTPSKFNFCHIPLTGQRIHPLITALPINLRNDEVY